MSTPVLTPPSHPRHHQEFQAGRVGVGVFNPASLWALVRYDVLTLPAASVVAPVVLVVAGAAGLVLTLARGRRQH